MKEYQIVLHGSQIDTALTYVETLEKVKRILSDLNKLASETLEVINGGNKVLTLSIKMTASPFSL